MAATVTASGAERASSRQSRLHRSTPPERRLAVLDDRLVVGDPPAGVGSPSTGSWAGVKTARVRLPDPGVDEGADSRNVWPAHSSCSHPLERRLEAVCGLRGPGTGQPATHRPDWVAGWVVCRGGALCRPGPQFYNPSLRSQAERVHWGVQGGGGSAEGKHFWIDLWGSELRPETSRHLTNMYLNYSDPQEGPGRPYGQFEIWGI